MKDYIPKHIVADETILSTSDGKNAMLDAKDSVLLAEKELSKANRKLLEVQASNKKLVKECNVRTNAIQQDIGKCNDVVCDLQHYLELYTLSAPEQMKLTSIIRETLRKRRSLLDYKALLSIALIDIGHIKLLSSSERNPPMSISEREEYHKNGSRTYSPKSITLKEALGLEE